MSLSYGPIIIGLLVCLQAQHLLYVVVVLLFILSLTFCCQATPTAVRAIFSHKKQAVDVSKDPLDAFLDSAIMDVDNPIIWWQSFLTSPQPGQAALARMALDVLSAPGTLVTLLSLFLCDTGLINT